MTMVTVVIRLAINQLISLGILTPCSDRGAGRPWQLRQPSWPCLGGSGSSPGGRRWDGAMADKPRIQYQLSTSGYLLFPSGSVLSPSSADGSSRTGSVSVMAVLLGSFSWAAIMSRAWVAASPASA